MGGCPVNPSIEKTLGFLKATGIATRKWHLEKSRVEEE